MDAWIRFWTALWLGWSDLSRRTIDLILCTTPTKQPTPDTPAAAPDGQAETEAGEQQEKSPPEKTGKRKTPRTQGSPALRILCVALAIGFIYGLPWTTRIAIAAAVLWTITALALGYLATMPPEEQKGPVPEQPAADDDQEQEPVEEPPADTRHPSELLPLEHVAVLLHGAYTEGSGVHLAHLAETLTTTPLMGLPATPWKTGHVRALLTRHKVRVRAGVRVPPLGGREGVHRRDFPPLPQPLPRPLLLAMLPQVRATTTTTATPPRPPSRSSRTPPTPTATTSTTPAEEHPMALEKTISLEALRRRNEQTKAAQQQPRSPAPKPTQKGR